MGYIICEKCGGYYELQPGEHPDDFDRCDCGGKLKYERHFIDENYDIPSPEKRLGIKLPPLSKNLKTLGLGAVAIVVLIAKFLPLLFSIILHFTPSQTIMKSNLLYLTPLIVIISIVVNRIFRFRRF